MNILNVDNYRDGGTVRIETDEGLFCIDYRIGSEIKGVVFVDYPKHNNQAPQFQVAELLRALSHEARFALAAKAKGAKWNEAYSDVILPYIPLHIVDINDPLQKKECDVPPEGWYCTREPGHEGPCAAIPEINIIIEKKTILWRKYWWQFWRPKPRKLKAKWTIEEQQPESYYDSCEDGDCGECLACSWTKMITEEIDAEIKREFQISN